MICQKVYEKMFDLLEMNYGKTLASPIKHIWKDFLDQELSDEEFTEAVRHAILHSRFMPTAGELVDYINGGKESKAIAEWQTILTAAASNHQHSTELLTYSSLRCRVALQSIGGLNAVAIAESDYQRSILQKQFITVFCQCSDKDTKVLPQASSQPSHCVAEVSSVVARGSRNNASTTPETASPMPNYVKQKLDALKAKISQPTQRSIL
jgi:hypothetical protein